MPLPTQDCACHRIQLLDPYAEAESRSVVITEMASSKLLQIKVDARPSLPSTIYANNRTRRAHDRASPPVPRLLRAVRLGTSERVRRQVNNLTKMTTLTEVVSRDAQGFEVRTYSDNGEEEGDNV
jgi:transcriptional regulator of met regulon